MKKSFLTTELGYPESEADEIILELSKITRLDDMLNLVVKILKKAPKIDWKKAGTFFRSSSDLENVAIKCVNCGFETTPAKLEEVHGCSVCPKCGCDGFMVKKD